MHLKKQAMPKNWPIQRKGTTFIVRPKMDLKKGLPVLVSLRDVLKIAKNRREVKQAINQELVLLNNRRIYDERTNVAIYDVLTIKPTGKHYRLIIGENKKFFFKETKKPGIKISKIIGKKILKKRKIQFNLSDGLNFIIDSKAKVGDSFVIDLETRKVKKHLGMSKGAKTIVLAGKHAGKIGVIDEIKDKSAQINAEKGKVRVLTKQIMIIE